MFTARVETVASIAKRVQVVRQLGQSEGVLHIGSGRGWVFSYGLW